MCFQTFRLAPILNKNTVLKILINIILEVTSFFKLKSLDLLLFLMKKIFLRDSCSKTIETIAAEIKSEISGMLPRNPDFPANTGERAHRISRNYFSLSLLLLLSLV